MIDMAEHDIPTMTHDVTAFNFHGTNILGIIDDNSNHAEIFKKRWNDEIEGVKSYDITIQPFFISSGSVGAKIDLHDNGKQNIHYTVKFSNLQIKLLNLTPYFGIFNTNGNLLFLTAYPGLNELNRICKIHDLYAWVRSEFAPI